MLCLKKKKKERENVKEVKRGQAESDLGGREPKEVKRSLASAIQ